MLHFRRVPKGQQIVDPDLPSGSLYLVLKVGGGLVKFYL